MERREKGGEKVELAQREAIARQSEAIGEELRKLGLDLPIDYATALGDQTTTELIEPATAEAPMQVAERPLVGQALWLRLRTGEPANSPLAMREGKLFMPPEPKGNLVCLYPGILGDNIGAMERNYVEPLLNDGYMVWASRHNGTRFESEKAREIIGARQRLADAETLHEQCTGLRPLRDHFEDWSRETEVDLPIWASQEGVNHISLVGHSYGGATVERALHALTQPGQADVLAKIDRFIALNALLGNGTFPDNDQETIATTRVTPADLAGSQLKSLPQYFDYPNPPGQEAAIESLRRLILRISGEDKRLPSSIDLVVVASPTDAYMTLEGAEAAIRKQSRGLLVVDLTQGGLPLVEIGGKTFGPAFGEIGAEEVGAANLASREAYGGSQHAMPNLRGETLRRLLEIPITGLHRVAVRRREPSEPTGALKF